MKSYSEYRKEQGEKKQLNIDKMKPIERLDYFNRVDRIKERYDDCYSAVLCNSFFRWAIIILLFGLLLVSLETKTGIIIGLLLAKSFVLIFGIGLFFIVFICPEIIIKVHLKNKLLNKLDEKYNL